MSFRQLCRYLELIPELLAKEHLAEAMVASFPHLDEKGRMRLVRDWQRMAGLKPPLVAGPTLSWEEATQLLKAPVGKPSP